MPRIALILLFLLPFPAWAWGPEGHQIVAHIAALELTPKARTRVETLLGGDAQAMMALDSTWADEIRDDRPETSLWHFVDIEMTDMTYVPARDCPGDNCVVAQITRDETILRSNASQATKAEALKFLIHFVGDIHQPLHAGEDHDRGGNAVIFRNHGRRTNLHHIWDDEVVAAQGGNPLEVARAIDAALTPSQKAQLETGGPRDWAMESANLARTEIYARLPRGIDLPERYPRAEMPFARLQLARAGFRLAMLLNAIFK